MPRSEGSRYGTSSHHCLASSSSFSFSFSFFLSSLLFLFSPSIFFSCWLIMINSSHLWERTNWARPGGASKKFSSRLLVFSSSPLLLFSSSPLVQLKQLHSRKTKKKKWRERERHAILSHHERRKRGRRISSASCRRRLYLSTLYLIDKDIFIPTSGSVAAVYREISRFRLRRSESKTFRPFFLLLSFCLCLYSASFVLLSSSSSSFSTGLADWKHPPVNFYFSLHLFLVARLLLGSDSLDIEMLLGKRERDRCGCLCRQRGIARCLDSWRMFRSSLSSSSSFLSSPSNLPHVFSSLLSSLFVIPFLPFSLYLSFLLLSFFFLFCSLRLFLFLGSCLPLLDPSTCRDLSLVCLFNYLSTSDNPVV